MWTTCCGSTTYGPEWHNRFLAMLPVIERCALIAFRNLTPELKEELLTETIASCFVAYHRLVERQLESRAYPTSLAAFAIRRVRAGILVATPRNQDDVSSRYGQLRSGARVEQLQGIETAED